MPALQLIQDLAVVMTVAALVTVVFHRLHLPVVLGYIAAGVIIGPHTPPFPLVHTESVYTLENLGLVFLMLSLGLSFSLRNLARVGPRIFAVGGATTVLLVFLGYQVAGLFGWSRFEGLCLGGLLCASSSTIMFKVMADLRLTGAAFARYSFALTLLEDVLAMTLIALLSTIAVTESIHVESVGLILGKVGVFYACVAVIGLLAVPGVLRYVERFHNREMLLISVLGWCFAVSLLAVKLGFSLALGAFLIGAVMAETRQQAQITALIEPLRDMFCAVFFVAIGMRIDPALLPPHLGAIVAVTVVLIVGKTGVCALGLFASGMPARTAFKVGMSLAQIGEFSFVIAGLGAQLGQAGDFLYPVAVSVSALSTLASPLLIRYSDGLMEALVRLAPRPMVESLRLYHLWIVRQRRRPTQGDEVRRLLRRWGWQMALNVALVTGVFTVGKLLGRYAEPYWPHLPAWTGGGDALLWLSLMVLSLPMLYATGRKLRATAMLVAEVAVPRSASPRHVATIRSVLTNVIFGSGLCGLALWLLALSSALLPTGPILIVLLVVLVTLALAMRTYMIRIYARAQVALKETLEEPPASVAPSTPPDTGHGDSSPPSQAPLL